MELNSKKKITILKSPHQVTSTILFFQLHEAKIIKETTEASHIPNPKTLHQNFTCVAVGDIDAAPERGPEQHSQHALASVLGDPVVIVDNTQEHQGMHHHLLYARGPCQTRADHVHRY
jgi:hypothetical protein